MNAELQESPAVAELAERVVEDIRARGLAPGDRYLTSEQVGRNFGAGKGVINRTLQLLGRRRVLIRRQRVGTLIGPNAPVRPAVQVKTVYALLPADRKDVFGFPFDLMLRAICERLPGVNLQFSFVPNHDSIPYVRELLGDGSGNEQTFGVVSISGSHEVNAYLAKSRIPTVAFSSYARDADSLPSVDLDLREGGRLLMRHLLDEGHRRIAFLNAAERRPGDNQLYDGMSEVLTAARVPHDTMIYRSLEPVEEVIHAETRRLLGAPNRPTALIGRVQTVAQTIARAVSEIGLNVPDDVEIAFIDHAVAQASGSPFPHVQPVPRFEETAATIGAMLKTLAQGGQLEEKHILVPVEFRGGRNRGREGARKQQESGEE